MSDHINRMKSERNLLNDKVVALSVFIYSNEKFDKLDKDEQLQMAKQLAHMEGYLRVLDERIACAC